MRSESENALPAVLSTAGRVAGPCWEKLTPKGPNPGVWTRRSSRSSCSWRRPRTQRPAGRGTPPNPKPRSPNPKPENRITQPKTLNPKPVNRNQNPETRNQETRNQEPQTLNPKPKNRNPTPRTRKQVQRAADQRVGAVHGGARHRAERGDGQEPGTNP